jgi:hypothetical protein
MMRPSTELDSSPATEAEEADDEDDDEEEDADWRAVRHSSSSGARTRASSAISSAKVDGE